MYLSSTAVSKIEAKKNQKKERKKSKALR